jgi:hypothetical protein
MNEKNGNKIIDSIVKGGAVAILGALLALTIWMNYRVSANHITHSTEAIIKNTAMLVELKNSMDNFTKAQDQTNRLNQAQTDAINSWVDSLDNLRTVILQIR